MERALEYDVRVHRQVRLPLGSFKNDVNGKFAASMLAVVEFDVLQYNKERQNYSMLQYTFNAEI